MAPSSPHLRRPTSRPADETAVQVNPFLLQLTSSELSSLHRATSSQQKQEKKKLSKISFQRRRTSATNDSDTEDHVLNQCNKYNSRGRCMYHPHIRLRRKRKKKILGSSKWQILHISCPSCSIENAIKCQNLFDADDDDDDGTASITRRPTFDSSITSSPGLRCMSGKHDGHTKTLVSNSPRREMVFRDMDPSNSHISLTTDHSDQDDNNGWIEVCLFPENQDDSKTVISSESDAYIITHALEESNFNSLIDIANQMYQDWQEVFGDMG